MKNAFDMYAKVAPDLVTASARGGVFSLIAVVLMAFMFITETYVFLGAGPVREVIDLEMDVQPSKRLRPVETARPVRAEGPGGKRAARRGDFDFKGKPRAEVSGARITVWYEEEHGGRKMDVPYVGVVNSCDPREGLYVKFEGFPEEMLITNEDDWQWGSHSRKPPARNERR